MASLKQVKELTELAFRLKLDGTEIFEEFKNTEMAGIFNGIGPDRMPEWMRGAINFLHPSLIVVAFIHDLEFEKGGDRQTFEASNTRFRTNGYIVAKANYGWYNPLRYIVMAKARRFAFYCQKFGWSAWAAPGDGTANPKKQRKEKVNA